MKPASKLYLTLESLRTKGSEYIPSAVLCLRPKGIIENDTHRDHWLLRRIRSVPGKSTAPFIISPMMHPTDHMSTENKNEMKINKKIGIEQQINENTWLLMPQSNGLTFH